MVRIEFDDIIRETSAFFERTKPPAGKTMGARDLTAGPAAKETDAEWTTITKNGKNKMPAYQGKLTDQQIGDLVKFMRTLK